MGAVQNSLNTILGSVAAASYAIGKGFGDSEGTKTEAPSIDLKMREKALMQALQKIDAINKQNLGRNNRMKAIRGVIDDFAKQDFTVKGGKE